MFDNLTQKKKSLNSCHDKTISLNSIMEKPTFFHTLLSFFHTIPKRRIRSQIFSYRTHKPISPRLFLLSGIITHCIFTYQSRYFSAQQLDRQRNTFCLKFTPCWFCNIAADWSLSDDAHLR